jgi:filamentous hemagglutinin
LDQAGQALLRTCASSSVCMNLLPAAGVAWLAAQLTQEFEAKQPSLADQIPGYGGGYGPKPGPSHTGNDKTTNPIPGGTSTTYPAEGPKESGLWVANHWILRSLGIVSCPESLQSRCLG